LMTLSAQASRSSTTAILQDLPPSDPVTPIWEYKILTFRSYAASKKTLGYPGPNLEDEINKLAEQGYVVERLQEASPCDSSGVGFSINDWPEIIVLLKRMKR
jgi:hypothetical protein